jgi:hypothetical protein
MSSQKYVKNLIDFTKEEDKREKLTILISEENKIKIKQNKINSSKLIDAFLSDFFIELERKKPLLSLPSQEVEEPQDDGLFYPQS